jgi:urea transporter
MNKGQKVVTVGAVIMAVVLGVSYWVEYPLVEVTPYMVGVMFTVMVWGGLVVAMRK